MAQHFTVGGYPNPDPHYISPEEESAILEAEHAEREEINMDARFETRVEAAADWLMADDSAYEDNREAALRAAREMLTIGDQIEARFEAASQRAIKALGDAP